MALLLVIDGLAGIPPAVLQSCPTLARLVGMGENGRLTPTGGGGFGEAWWRLLGMPIPLTEGEGGPPLGFLVALGSGLDPDPRHSWARLAFVHLHRHREHLYLLPPGHTGCTPAESRALAAQLLPQYAELGWTLHEGVGGHWVVEGELAGPVRSHSPAAALGQPVVQLLPWGGDAFPLRRLMTDGQLTLARHPVNREREGAGRPPLNSPWLWGVGTGGGLPLAPAGNGRCWSADPVVLGMARASGLAARSPGSLTELAVGVDEAVGHLAVGPVVIHLGWEVTGEGGGTGAPASDGEGWQRLDREFLEPLVLRMSGSPHSLLACGGEGGWLEEGAADPLSTPGTGDGGQGTAPGGRGGVWLRVSPGRLGRRRRFWHRGRLGRGGMASLEQLRSWWHT